MQPKHFSRDIAGRCLDLLTRYSGEVERGVADDVHHGGPLTTTFLVAMATPIVVLPFERLFKVSAGQVLADDSTIDPALEERVSGALAHGKKFRDAPFGTGTWAKARIGLPFNLAGEWNDAVFDALALPKALADAQDADAITVVRLLRNALAHGGIAYLDEDGRQAKPVVAQIAFASFKFNYDDCCNPKPEAVNLLRTTEENFRAFVYAWAKWLRDTGIAEAPATGQRSPQ